MAGDPFLDALAAVRSGKPGGGGDPFMDALSAVRSEEGDDADRGWLESAAPMALRVGGGIAGTVLGTVAMPGAGTVAGGALGSGIGEYLAQQLEKSRGERDSTSLAQVGIQTTLGAIPGMGHGKSLLGTVGKSAAQGGVLGGGAVTAESLLERGELPSAGEFAAGAGGGAVFGGALGGALDGGRRLVSGLRARDVKPPAPAGYLPPGSFTAASDGRVGRPGEVIDLQAAPDGSFVRGVPAEFARREVRGLLPAGPRFAADAAGNVAPIEQADELTRAAQPAPRPEASGVRAVRAPIADREIDGGRITRQVFSGDPDAADAPLFSADVRGELERMRAEIQTFAPERGGLIEGVPGGNRPNYPGGEGHYVPRVPGARVAEDIRTVADSRAGNEAIANALDSLLSGKGASNKLALAAIETARARVEGRPGFSRPSLPSGWRSATGGDAPAAGDFAAFSRMVDDVEPGPPGTEAGEAGFIAAALAPKLGGAAAGAAAGASTGDTTEDRTARAMLGAGAGFVGGAMVARQLARPGLRIVDGLTQRQPAASGRTVVDGMLRPIGAAGQGGPIRDPLKGFEPFISKFTNPLVREGVRERLQAHAGFTDQRRGVMPNDMTARLAERVAVDVSRTLPKGTSLNAEQVTAYARAVDKTMGEVQRLASVVNSGKATDADLLALKAAEADHAVVLASMVGARAEAGRALQAFRAFSGAIGSADVNLIRAATKGLREDAQELARKLAAAGSDPLARYEVLKTSASSTLLDKARSYYYANILSGVKTHERNFLGNAFNAMSNLLVHPAAAGVDAARSAATGKPRTVMLGELPHQAVGTFAGMERGLRDFAFTLRHGVSPDNLSRSLGKAEQQGQFDVPRVELPGGGANPLNYPGRLLEATDALFRSINRHSELYGLAYTKARSAGLKGRALEDRMAALIAGTAPDAGELQQQAATFARRAVFQEEAGPITAWLQRGHHVPVLKYVMPFVMPFIRTPANILRQGLEFSPAGAVMQAAQQEGRAGVQAQARVAAGTAAAGLLAWLAATGRLSGSGPRDSAERASLMESGWRPNSIRIGDQWVSYSLFQPVSVQAAIVANAFEAWREQGADADAASAAASTVFRSIDSFLDQSFLSGLFDVVQAISRGDVSPDAGMRTVGRTAHSLTPLAGLQRTVRDALDPVQRRPETAGDAFRVNVPGLSDSVRPRVDRFGEVVTREGGRVRRAADPLNVSSIVDDSVAREMDRLGVRLNLPADEITRRGERIELTSQQEVALQQLKGRAIRFALERVMASPGYQRMSDERRADRLERTIRSANQRASRTAPRQLGVELRPRVAAR